MTPQSSTLTATKKAQRDVILTKQDLATGKGHSWHAVELAQG
ncbi:MAG: hypothetical protein AAGD09_17335 [Cyanobacteria bacterium P01_F01_bin.56]